MKINHQKPDSYKAIKSTQDYSATAEVPKNTSLTISLRKERYHDLSGQ